MKITSSAAITTTIAATVGSPPNTPRRAMARAKHTVSAVSAIAAPKPNDGPVAPSANAAPNVQTTANADAIAVPRSNSRNAQQRVATAAPIVAHRERSPPTARRSAEEAPVVAHGTNSSAASATPATY